MYAAVATTALGTTVITTTATTQLTYADNGIGNDLDNDGDNECGTKDCMDDGNNGLGNSYTTESPDDHDKGIGNDNDRDGDKHHSAVTHHPATGRSNYHQYVALITIG